MSDSHERFPHIEALREIGWTIWDPLNLHCLGWREQGGENEYASYLVRAAEMLEQGASQDMVIRYLIYIETDHMGMDASATAPARARMVVEAISALISEEAVK